MAEEKVSAVVSAHAYPGGDRLESRVAAADEWHHLMNDIGIVGFVADCPVVGVNIGICPGMGVYTVNGVKGDITRIDEILHTADHAAVFKIMEAARLGGEYQDWLTGMTVEFQLHVLVQALTVPFVIFNVQAVTTFSRMKSAMALMSSMSGERTR